MKKSILLFAIALTLFSCKKEDPVIEPIIDPVSTVNLPADFAALEGIFDGNGIGAAVNLTEDIVLFFNMDGDRYAWFEENQVHVVKSLDDPEGHFANYSGTTVGAAVLFNGTTLYFMDAPGNIYRTANFNVQDVDEGYIDFDVFTFSTNSHDLTEWGPDFTCPFPQVSAMLNWSQPNSCFNASEDTQWTAMINGNGDEFSWYYSPDGGNFGTPEEIENWVFENYCNGPGGILPFDRISAACRYVKPNGIQELFFNQDGKTFTIQNVSEGVFSEIYSLY